MNFEQAFKRIIWRFENCELIKVNSKDIFAFNIIIDFINQKQNEVLAENEPFIKLYAFSLGYFLKKYNTTLSNEIPHRELHKLLNRPLNNIISDLTSEINFRLKYKILEKAGCDFNKHPATTSNDTHKKLLSRLEKHLEIANNREIFLGDAWDPQTVEMGIKYQAKQFINEF